MPIEHVNARYRGHERGVWSVAWSPDQRRALSGSADGTVRVWDIETGRCLHVLDGHHEDAAVPSVAWSADQRRAFSGDAKGMVWSWSVPEG